MAGLATVVAAAAGSGAAQAEGRAVSLDVAQSLAVIALLGLGGTGERAAVGLMACSWNRQYGWWYCVRLGRAIPGCLPVKGELASRTSERHRTGKNTVVAKALGG